MAISDYRPSAIPWPLALDWSAAELRGYLAAAADPALQHLATRCPAWTVHDLTAHLAATFRRFADQLMGHQRGPVPVGLQAMWGLSELAVHHDDLADATGGSYRPGDPIVAALVAMKQAVDGFHVRDDPWLEYLRSTGRHIATASEPSR